MTDSQTMKRYAGFSLETTFGTPTDAAVHVDGITSTLDPPKNAEITVPSGLYRAARRKVRNFYLPAGTVEYAWDIETIGYNFLFALGSYKYTAGAGAPAPNTHEMYGDDNIIPRYFTTRIGKDKFEHVFDGCAMNALSVSVGDGLLNVNNDIIARKDSKEALPADDDLLLPTDVPLAFHNFTASIGSTPTDISAKVRTFNLAIRNNIDGNRGKNAGSPYARRHRFGARVVEYSATLEFEDLDMLEAFWGDETGPADIGSTLLEDFKLVFAPHDEGEVADPRQLEILLPTIDVKTSALPPRTSDALYHEISGQAYVTPDVTLADTVTKVSTDIYVKLLNNTTAMFTEE